MEGVSSSVNAQTFTKRTNRKLGDHYQIGEKLGEGGFGEVRLCIHKTSGDKRAVKFLKKARLEGWEEKMILNEIEIMSEMDHPNIVRLFEFFNEPDYYCIVQGYCAGGELFDAIISSGKLTENTARVAIRALLSCINYCHKKGVVHRDLKPENILMEADMDFNKMKIIDFGNAGHKNIF